MGGRSRGRLMARFEAIARDRLGRLDTMLADIERHPDDDDLAKSLLREIHTLKGEARMMGIEPVNRLAHDAESILHRAKREPWRLPAAGAELVVEGLDLISRLIDNLDAMDEAGVDIEQYSRTVGAWLGGEEPEAAPQAPSARAPAPEAVPTPVAPPAPTPPAKPGPVGFDEPSPASESDQATAARDSTGRSDTYLNVALEKIEPLSDMAGDLLLGQAREEALLLTYRSEHETLVREGRTARRQRSLAINVEDLDRDGMLEFIDVLRIAVEEAEFLERATSDLLTVMWDESFDRRMRLQELDNRLRDLRLLPISSVFGRFPSAMRQLGRQQGKKVRVTVQGGDVEVDKQVLDLVADPLLHLTRNAVDHGVEIPKDRLAAGKPDTGTISLSAEQVGPWVEIAISDDGAGISPDRIRERALAKGLVNPDEAAALTSNNIVQMVFRTGFSTKDEVSDVSGRGVGLSVVKDVVDSVGGEVWIESEAGRGSTFRLRLPISMVLSRAMLIQVAGASFAFPSEVVLAATYVDEGTIEEAGHVRIFRWEGLRVPLVSLGAVLGVPGRHGVGARHPVVLVEHMGERVGFQVTRFVGQQQVLHRPLDSFLDGLPLVQGVVVLPNSELALVLNAAEAIRHAGFAQAIDTEGGQEGSKQTATILVVDDSEFTRDIVTSTLRLAGYQVTEAVNGRLGFDRFVSDRPDLVLTDLDMPVMDGFGLLREIRSLPDAQRVPVLVFSTRGAVEDKRRAAELGADGYIVKSEFQEQDLVRTVRLHLAPKRS